MVEAISPENILDASPMHGLLFEEGLPVEKNAERWHEKGKPRKKRDVPCKASLRLVYMYIYIYDYTVIFI